MDKLLTRILVVSDSHGRRDKLALALRKHRDAALVFHLGDGLREAGEVLDAAGEAGREVRFAAGNGDWGVAAPGAGLELVAGRRIFYTHGHIYEVKRSYDRVICAAREREADLLLFGHTHAPLARYADGLYVFNPGSLREGAYGIVDFAAPADGGAAAIVPRLLTL